MTIDSTALTTLITDLSGIVEDAMPQLLTLMCVMLSPRIIKRLISMFV